MTIEEKMDHFRSLSLESASSKSAESLSSYKQSLDDDLELHKEEEIKAKYGDKDYGTEKTKFYGRTNENQKRTYSKTISY